MDGVVRGWAPGVHMGSSRRFAGSRFCLWASAIFIIIVQYVHFTNLVSTRYVRSLESNVAWTAV